MDKVTIPTEYLYDLAKELDGYRDRLMKLAVSIHKLPDSADTRTITTFVQKLALAGSLAEINARTCLLEEELKKWR